MADPESTPSLRPQLLVIPDRSRNTGITAKEVLEKALARCEEENWDQCLILFDFKDRPAASSMDTDMTAAEAVYLMELFKLHQLVGPPK